MYQYCNTDWSIIPENKYFFFLFDDSTIAYCFENISVIEEPSTEDPSGRYHFVGSLRVIQNRTHDKRQYPRAIRRRKTRSFSLFDISIVAKVFPDIGIGNDEEARRERKSSRRVYTWGEYYKSAIVIKEKVPHHPSKKQPSPGYTVWRVPAQYHPLLLAASRHNPSRTNLHIYGECLTHQKISNAC